MSFNMSLSKFIERIFQTKTRSITDPVTNTVATTVTQILKNNPDRLAYTIVNLTAYDVHVAFDREVSTTRGILISASGGSLSLRAEEDGELVGYELWGISTTGASTIFTIVTEGD